MNGIEIQDLACERGGRVLFSNLNFTINPGQSLRLTGPNGCGKSTLLKTLANRLKPMRGRILHPDSSFYLDHRLLMKNNFTVSENLEFWAKILNAQPLQVTLALKQMGLNQLSTLTFKDLSSGQKKRVQLALLTLTQSSLWILDEPLLSLDSTYSQQLGNLIYKHLQEGGIVIYASHDPIPCIQDQTLDLSALRGLHVRHAA